MATVTIAFNCPHCAKEHKEQEEMTNVTQKYVYSCIDCRKDFVLIVKFQLDIQTKMIKE